MESGNGYWQDSIAAIAYMQVLNMKLPHPQATDYPFISTTIDFFSMEQPKIMGMGDVMRVLGVSRQRVVEFVRQDKLRPIHTSAGKIFEEKEVMAFKKEREGRAKTNPRIKRGR